MHPDHYLIKPFDAKQLKIAIEIAADNYYNPNADQIWFRKLHCLSAGLGEPLSDREVDVLKLLEEGLSNQLIAERLFVSENTVKTHLKNLYLKTGVSTRSELMHKLGQV